MTGGLRVHPHRTLGAACLVLVAVTGSLLPLAAGPAGAASETVTISGGTFLAPGISSLLKNDAANLSPDETFYSSETLDSAIADFVGTAPNTYNADAVLSERPLTAAESATAQTDGRSFAYVPFAATPVAIVTLVPNSSYQVGSPTIAPSDFCQHIDLSVDELGGLFGYDTTDPYTWGDPRLTCAEGGTLDSYPVTRWANLDVTMENETLMSLLDSEPTSKAEFDAGLAQAAAQQAAVSTSDTPSESWPYAADTYPQGDQNLIGHMLSISSRTNIPSTNASLWALGAIAPISAEWTGAPLGAVWDLPTAAVENAAGADVAPSVAAAQAAEASSTLASDGTVTFNPSQDATAYNNYLMVEDYLVVPTNGLDASKDKDLAQLIRYALGTAGQADLESYGSAPATSAMVTSGLKVAAELDQAAANAPATAASSTTTSTTTAQGGSTTTATTALTAGSAEAASSDGGSSSTGGTGGTGGGSSGGLAFTGAGAIVPLAAFGTLLTVFGTALRRRIRRRHASTGPDLSSPSIRRSKDHWT